MSRPQTSFQNKLTELSLWTQFAEKSLKSHLWESCNKVINGKRSLEMMFDQVVRYCQAQPEAPTQTGGWVSFNPNYTHLPAHHQTSINKVIGNYYKIITILQQITILVIFSQKNH